ncbi:hypothetical protein E2562_004882 [Oryza meyeriana var. granulata]|uniref:KIB1-4 beta-propeller domain-containing protein n=1 Tax=Oryza meyeriana var. granulata TaxID=110450 RepID=A0A6G1C4Y0_9ORYZ|nr:hypothetical protein E2562_004882 [Oryza meyeriana var. granulata]
MTAAVATTRSMAWRDHVRTPRPRWRELPVDIVGEVMQLLRNTSNRLRFTTVCHDWRSAGRQFWRRRRPAAAFLALPDGSFFWFPEFKESRRFDDCANYCGAACDDWFLFHGDGGDGRLRLMSPFTKRTRWLPSLSDICFHREPIVIVNEPAPAGTPPQWRSTYKMAVQKLVTCPNGIVAAIVGREHFAKVALCSLGGTTWSLSEHDRWRWYEDMAFSDGKLYALTNGEDLLAFDVGEDANTGQPTVTRVERVIEGGSDDGSSRGYVTMRYLVRSRRCALLMVQRLIIFASKTVLFTVLEARTSTTRRRRHLRGGSRYPTSAAANRCSSAGCAPGRCRRERRLGSCTETTPRYPGDKIFFLTNDWAGMSFRTARNDRTPRHAAVYDMRERKVSELPPPQIGKDAPAPATWLFPDTDLE